MTRRPERSKARADERDLSLAPIIAEIQATGITTPYSIAASLPATEAIYQRFAGISGSAYFVGGLGMTALTANDIVLVPIRSGIGLRLGANVGYLKFTPQSTWNPF
jgi:hypothetical protein